MLASCGPLRLEELSPVSPCLKHLGENWPSIREQDASAAVKTIVKGRTANPVASAISGQALILAGLLLLRRP
jgi:hypothetical protein